MLDSDMDNDGILDFNEFKVTMTIINNDQWSDWYQIILNQNILVPLLCFYNESSSDPVSAVDKVSSFTLVKGGNQGSPWEISKEGRGEIKLTQKLQTQKQHLGKSEPSRKLNSMQDDNMHKYNVRYAP